MIDAGVDFIATSMDINGMLTLAKELERQGVRDQITMLHPNSYDPTSWPRRGSLRRRLRARALRAVRVRQRQPAATRLRPVGAGQRRAGGRADDGGWINADLFVTGLLEAGPEFGRQAIIDSLNQITYGADGLINPIDWSRQHTAVVPGVYDHAYGLECVSYVRDRGRRLRRFPTRAVDVLARRRRGLVRADSHRLRGLIPGGPPIPARRPRPVIHGPARRAQPVAGP